MCLKCFCDAPIRNGGLKRVYGSQRKINSVCQTIVFDLSKKFISFVSLGLELYIKVLFDRFCKHKTSGGKLSARFLCVGQTRVVLFAKSIN